MADDPKNQQEINRLLEEENKLLRERLQLQSEGYDLSSSLLENLKDVLGIQSKRNTFDSGLLDLNRKINRAVRDQKIEFNNIKDIQKQIKRNIDLINKSKLFETSIENTLSKNQKKRADNYLKEISIADKLNKQIEEELSKSERGEKIDGRRLGSLKGRLTQTLNILKAEEKKLGNLAKQYVYTKQNTKQLEDQNKLRIEEGKSLTNIQKQLGLFGGILKGLEKIGPLRGLGVDFDEVRAKAEATTKATGSGIKGLQTGLKTLGSSFKSMITTPSNLALLFIQQFLLALKDADKLTGELAKSFNITYNEASNLREELIQIGNKSGEIVLNSKALQESIIAVGKALGSNAVLNEQDLITFTKIREQAGLTNAELVEMQKLTYVSGVNLKNNIGNLLSSAKITGLNNKILLNEKDIMRDVSKTSKAIQVSLSGSGKALGEAAAQAKIFGMNMKQVENIAGSLLDFESSISAELEAELLTGKNLNLERARLYAINNDMAGVSREIRKNYGDIEEFSRMNRIQQEAAAKAVGMTREDLAATLTDEKALKGLNNEKRNAAQAALEFARAKGMTESEISKKSIEDLMKQQSIQERINNTVDKLQEMFMNLSQPLMPLLDSLTTVLELVGYILKPLEWMNNLFGSIGEKISKLIGPLESIGKVIKTVAGLTIVWAAYKAFASLATIPVAGAALGTAASAAILLAGFGVLNKIKDGVIDSKKGPIVSGEFGSVQLSDRDTAVFNGKEIIAGTKLKQNNQNQNNLQEIKLLRNELANLSNRPIHVSVEMDGEKVAKGIGKHANEFYTYAGANIRQIS